MRALALLAVPALLGASAPVPGRPQPIAVALKAAQAEARAALAEQRRLERFAEAARNQADRLRARQAAAAQAIAAAEAGITAADAEHRLARARLTRLKAQLQERQRPVTSLLAGLAMMGRRPPLLALAHGSSTEEMVRVRILLDSTLPVIRKRAAGLSRQLTQVGALERHFAATLTRLDQRRSDLAARRQAFAALEARALRQAAAQGSGALSAGDLFLAAGEESERLAGEAQSVQAAAGIARELAALGPAPLRPAAPAPAPPPLRYRLPATAAVTNGFGAVSASGVRSRGITLATRRGSALAVPADGIVRFAGPFRDYDGIIIIDHGRGWMSLIVGVASPLEPGRRVRSGDPLGRALGAIEVELSTSGRRVSPALIAGSSATLSNKAEKG